MDNNQQDISIEKATSLFKYIEELHKLRKNDIVDIDKYEWLLKCADLPKKEDKIRLFYQDRVKDDSLNEDIDEEAILLSVQKEEYTACPLPPKILDGWLSADWNNYKEMDICFSRRNIVIKDKVSGRQEEKEVSFEEERARVTAYNTWILKRNKWAAKQKKIAQNNEWFIKLYRAYFDLQRNGEIKEMVVANGIFCHKDGTLKHPILLRKVCLEFDAEQNIILIRDTEAISELYSDGLKQINGLNLQEIPALRREVAEKEYHPLDRNETLDFFKVFIRKLTSKGQYVDTAVLDGWENKCDCLIYNEPYFFIRKRPDGTVGAIEKILESVQEKGIIPKTILDLTQGGIIAPPLAERKFSIDKQLAMVGGESEDILLSKEANREQLEIAQRIEKYSAVLVQGPPGTGKTHTIANLLGHFISQGKSILVTSQTTKALTVLKDKIVPGLQSLCVSLLDDSNKDMQKSVAGITDFMSEHSASELKKEIEVLGRKRQDIIAQLSEVRKKIFMSLQQECQSITYQGESFTPTEAAKFVSSQRGKLDYIPGKVIADSVLPLTFNELAELYQSNSIITEEDVLELNCILPAPTELWTLDKFSEICNDLNELQEYIKSVNSQEKLKIKAKDKRIYCHNYQGKEFSFDYPAVEALQNLKKYCQSYVELTPWQQSIILDVQAGGGYKKRWENFVAQINKTKELGAEFADKSIGEDIEIAEDVPKEWLLTSLKEARNYFDNNDTLPMFFSFLHKDCSKALKSVQISGHFIKSKRECELAIIYIELSNSRWRCNNFWEELLVPHKVPAFIDFGSEPERHIEQYLCAISRSLHWTEVEYPVFIRLLNMTNFPETDICGISMLDSGQVILEKRLQAMRVDIPLYCNVCEAILKIDEYKARLHALEKLIYRENRVNSNIMQKLYQAVNSQDVKLYGEGIRKLTTVYDKYNLLHRRNEYLKRLSPYAPDWVKAIQDRVGIHGRDVVPTDIMDAWKWKQLSLLLDEINSTPLSDYQIKSKKLSVDYRQITAKYAEKLGWYWVLSRVETDLSLQQALQGWRIVVGKIGKGTGKRAPKFRAEARELMKKCQKAVPAWIMPIHKALENLNPAENIFDIVILDEASQADISSLAILYMGKKVIIVGDDKQVSPIGVGVDNDKMDEIRKMYLAKDIPNDIIYDAQTSIYDLAMTTYHPLMLKEHFRCVPEIISYSNWLSYEGKILPLRSASSSNLLPAVVNYRVTAGSRDVSRKINIEEAKAIVALMQACIEQPEYAGKTFGVISLLGSEQARYIENLISNKIKAVDIEKREILCGDSSNFQGDERDVIFLSLVDSPKKPDEPLHLLGYGFQDKYRKRYNVAVSRARDQLWVVHSLDNNVNLKPGDIRKGLIEFAMNPSELEMQRNTVSALADSEFEVQVAMQLKSRGYHIIQQWKVGAYRIDMVALCGDTKVAIECDGDRYHSSPEQVRNDMERQTILERLGWNFIRIRGSEYFRNPNVTINRVINDLQTRGIYPENEQKVKQQDSSTTLLARVKQRAAMILAGKEKKLNNDTISLQSANNDTSYLGKLSAKDDDYAIKQTPLVAEPIKFHRQVNTDVGIVAEDRSKGNLLTSQKKTFIKNDNNIKQMSLGIEPIIYQMPINTDVEMVAEDSGKYDISSLEERKCPADLPQAIKLLKKENYTVIESTTGKVVWLPVDKAMELYIKQLLGPNFTVKWSKRGIKQTNNKSFLSIRRK